METKKEVIIKVLPLPIPVGTPVPAPVHIGVPAAPPFAPSPYGQYDPLPLYDALSLGPRMDKLGETEQVGNRRSADPDHSIIGGHSDTHTHTTHHHTHSSHELPSGKILGILQHALTRSIKLISI